MRGDEGGSGSVGGSDFSPRCLNAPQFLRDRHSFGGGSGTGARNEGGSGVCGGSDLSPGELEDLQAFPDVDFFRACYVPDEPCIVRGPFPHEGAFRNGFAKMCSRLNWLIKVVEDKDAIAEIHSALGDVNSILQDAYPDFEPDRFEEPEVDRTLSGAVHTKYADFNFLFPGSADLDLPPFEAEILHRLEEAALSVDTALRKAACMADASLVKGSWSLERLGEVQATKGKTHCVDVAFEHGLCVGDEIVIGGDYNRVVGFGSIKTCFTVVLRDSGDLHMLCVRPVVPADHAIEGKTQTFIDNVDVHDESQHDHLLRELLMSRGVDDLPPDVSGRKKKMVSLYTGDDFFRDVNKAMYEDSKEDLRKFAPFIRELRDVFLAGQSESDRVVEPFSGLVRRRMILTPELVELYTKRKGQEVCWAAFTSTSEAKYKVKVEFGGSPNTAKTEVVGWFHIWVNVQKAVCPEKYEQYVPASIKEFSQYQTEYEVLLPPHTCLRIINVEYGSKKGEGSGDSGGSGTSAPVLSVEMETCEWPSIWVMCEEGQWDKFCEWAEAHKDIIDTSNRHFSIINAVAAHLIHAPTSAHDPLKVCIKLGANVNEVDPLTHKTPLISVAEHVSEGSRDLEGTLRFLLDEGAHPKLIHPHLSDLLPDFVHAQRQLGVIWLYWVDDGVDGKETAWYGYEYAAGEAVEKQFQQWLSSKDEAFAKVLSISSCKHQYDVDFTSRQQTNTKTNKVRKIRRYTHDLAKETGLCPMGYEWVMEEQGWRCKGGEHFVVLEDTVALEVGASKPP